MQIKVLSKLIEVLKCNAQKLRWNRVKLRISKVVRINAKTVAPFIMISLTLWNVQRPISLSESIIKYEQFWDPLYTEIKIDEELAVWGNEFDNMLMN